MTEAYNPAIKRHRHTKSQGWCLDAVYPSDSPLWGEAERGWIAELLHKGHMSLLVGDAMFEVAK